MNPYVGAPTRSIRAAASVVEAVCCLPAVPTQDWCERAAQAMLAVRQPSIALVMFARANAAGEVSAVECVGAAGCSVAEVGTTVRGLRARHAAVSLGLTHPAIGRIRAAAHGCAALGWSPAAPAGDPPAGADERRAVVASELADPGPVRARWAETGAREVVVGAAALGQPGSGRYLIVEIGVSDAAPAEPGAAAPTGAEEAAVLDAILPILARQAGTAFGPSPFSEATCLTRREVQVLEHLLFGRSVKQIAEQLGRSQHTVHDHVKALHRKLAASSRGALIARALGYLGPDGTPPNGPFLADLDGHN